MLVSKLIARIEERRLTMSYIGRMIFWGLLELGIAMLLNCIWGHGAEEMRSGDTLLIDFRHEVRYFTGAPSIYPWPDYRLLQDEINNRILNAALSGATQAEFERAGITEAASRLDALVRGQCLHVEGGVYRISFPVIYGEARQSIRAIVDAAAASAVPSAAEMVASLERAAPGRRDVLFHLLWSRSMDQFWWSAWTIVHGKSKNAKDGIPAVAYVLSPDHSRQVGTNYNDLPGDGQIAVTWSNKAQSHVKPIGNLRIGLTQMAWGLPPTAPEAVKALRAAGCLNEAGHLKPFVIHNGDHVDKLTREIARQYATLVANLYDYDALASRFRIAPGQMFVILQHETAFAIYDLLIARGDLAFPDALEREGNPEACAQLVSLRLKKRLKQ